VPVGDVAQEAARGPAVADPVVEGQRQLGHLADGQLPADSPGPLARQNRAICPQKSQ
jgi:hypothetical protein